jgi:hypothetical protein
MQAKRDAEEFRLFPTLMVLGMVLLAGGQVKLLLEVSKLKEGRSELDGKPRTEAIPEVNETARSPRNQSDGDGNPNAARAAGNRPIVSPSAVAHTVPNVAALEQRVNELARMVQQPSPGVRAVAEYNAMSPAVAPEEPNPQPTVQKRSWGQEQAVGVPDTAQAADMPSAWASREQDAGPEWLQLDFENAVDVAEVRIRESFNPGAISKVTGMVNGQEVVLWEGTATGGTAPRDFVVPVEGHLQANSVVVHLDTARVAGWNEIDAVELVGKDGSRQWASSANASSTYAERQHSHPRSEQLGVDADGQASFPIIRRQQAR